MIGTYEAPIWGREGRLTPRLVCRQGSSDVRQAELCRDGDICPCAYEQDGRNVRHLSSGTAGMGANVGPISARVNVFVGRWFDENWHATINTKPWKNAVGAYVEMLKNCGPAGSSANNFNENLAFFAGEHCAIWIDAAVAEGILSDKRESQVRPHP